jgi:putative hydrolase of the HAD superfamily
MAIEAVVFDLYGTLVDIWTDEWDPETYRVLSRFLAYYDLHLAPEVLAAQYQELTATHMLEHPGPYGEIDVFRVFEEILAQGGKQPLHAWVLCVARLFRALTRRRFKLFADTLPALAALQDRWQLAIVSDAQWVFSEPELRILGLEPFFEPVVLSSRYFVRKPDPQIYAHALKGLHLNPSQALYVGDNPEEDLPGPQALGMPVALIDRGGQHGPLPAPVLRDLQDIPAFIGSLGAS